MENCPSETAVQVSGAWKRYSRKEGYVLKNLTANVQTATIYGLLGESGCGKTTLLTCIVGLRELDSGVIHVWGKQPGTVESAIPGSKVGYMPQDTSVYPDMTIEEILYLFGSFHELSSDDIKEKTRFYVELLDLPDKRRFVSSLSGGQQRRVSFAIALFHDPQLLVLDEPTVGVDPLLRQILWEHLVLLSEAGKTIIISTHYIEEVKQAHKVGFLRNGRTLTEGSPTDLLRNYETTSLERVYLEEARAYDEQESSLTEAVPSDSIYCTKKRERCAPRRLFSWTIIKALIWKEAVRLLRHYIILVNIIAIPIFNSIINIVILENNFGGARFGVINKEMTNGSSCLDTPLMELDGCNLTRLSCHFLQSFRETAPAFTLSNFDNEDEATEAIRAGNIYGAFVFKENFTENFKSRLLDAVHVKNDSVEKSNVFILRDGGTIHSEFALTEALLQAMRDFSSAVLQSCDFNPAVNNLPVTVSILL